MKAKMVILDYYVRVIQTNKQMAWASPIWVRRAD